MTEYDVMIVGGGPAGATAALYTARAALKTIVFDKSVTAGALGLTSKIANYPGIPEIISGEELVTRIWSQAGQYGAEFKKTKVVSVDFSGDIKTVFTAEGESFRARAVILATGAMGRSSALPGEEQFLGRGVSYCATCDGAFFKGKEVLVYGSGGYAFEEALFLTRFAKKVHFVSAKFPSEEKVPGNFQVYPEARLTKVLGEGKVTGAEIATPRGVSVIPVEGVFIYSAGNKPVVDYLFGNVGTNEKMCILVDKEYRTNMPGVFACGDVLCNDVQQAVVAAGQGCIAALSADKYLRGRKSYVKDYK